MIAYEELCQKVLDVIEQGPDSGFDCFEEYALEEFNYQYAHNEVYQEFVNARGVSPANITHWEDTPLIYNDVFKKELVASFPFEQSVMMSLTSGTTALSQRGHIFRDEWGKKLVLTANRVMTQTYLFPDFEEGARCRILILAPSPEMAPSMGMAIGMDETRKAFGTPDSMFVMKRSGIEVDKLLGALRESEDSGVPIALIGATSAYVYFFNACRRDGISFNLPEGSRVCDGGGYRGRFGVVTRDDYYRMVEEILNVPNHWCINTLGAAETATNLFDDTIYRAVKGLPSRETRCRPVPPWSHVKALDIHDLSILPDGETGLLAHWDLANAPMVMGLITDNLGYTSHDGNCCEIVGRAKVSNNKISELPDEDRTVGAMGDKPIFRMLEGYTNFTIDMKMRFAKNKSIDPSPREEVEAREGGVASCPAVVDDMLLAGEDADAAANVQASVEVFEKVKQEEITNSESRKE